MIYFRIIFAKVEESLNAIKVTKADSSLIRDKAWTNVEHPVRSINN